MKANYEDKIQKPSAEVALGNLYEMNKQLMEQMKPINREEKLAAYDGLKAWFKEHNTRYYMLLCHDLRDYTMFNLDRTGSWHVLPVERSEYAARDVLECMENRGRLLAVDLQPDGAWEIWIRCIEPEGCFAYYLFPYDDAVIEY